MLLSQAAAKTDTLIKKDSATQTLGRYWTTCKKKPKNFCYTHRVPLGVHLFLLELGKLSPVVDDHQQLPDEQQGQANQDDAGDHARHDGDDIGAGGAV